LKKSIKKDTIEKLEIFFDIDLNAQLERLIFPQLQFTNWKRLTQGVYFVFTFFSVKLRDLLDSGDLEKEFLNESLPIKLPKEMQIQTSTQMIMVPSLLKMKTFIWKQFRQLLNNKLNNQP